MEFFDVVAQRRSVRIYTKEAVTDGVIQKCIDSALLAPNSSNMQPWEFYWVRSPEKKAELVKACFGQPAAATAPEIVVIVARRDTWRRNVKLMLGRLSQNPAIPKRAKDYYSKLIPFAYSQGIFGSLGFFKGLFLNTAGLFRPMPRGPSGLAELDQMLVKSTALACQNFMLAAVAQGYGCCPMEGYDEVRVKQILGIRWKACRVVMAISVGKPDAKGIFGPQLRFDKNLFVFEV